MRGNRDDQYWHPLWSENYDSGLHLSRDATCQYQYPQTLCGTGKCGLRAWRAARENEPRCMFHSREAPADVNVHLQVAVEAGMSLREGRLNTANLQEAELKRACLQGAEPHDTPLTFAELSGADLRHSVLCEWRESPVSQRFAKSPLCLDHFLCIFPADSRRTLPQLRPQGPERNHQWHRTHCDTLQSQRK